MSAPETVRLPSTFNRLAWSNLAAQSAEQIALAAAPIVAVLVHGASEGETGLLQTALTSPFVLVAIPAGLLADRAAAARESARLRLDRVRLVAPVPRPSKIIGIGLNYRDHAAETGQDLPTRPTVFAKFPTTLSGPYDPIVLPALSSAVDYEGEFGVVIGREARAQLAKAEGGRLPDTLVAAKVPAVGPTGRFSTDTFCRARLSIVTTT